MRASGVALLGALALAACGRGGGSGTSSMTGVPGGGGTQEAAWCPNGVTLRLLGTSPGNISSLVVPTDAGAACAFAPVCAMSNLQTGPFDLSSDAHSHDLGVILMPKDSPPVTVRLAFGGSGGVTLDGVPRLLDTCGSVITFTFDAFRVNPARCEVRIVLDVGRSVIASSPVLAEFLPRFRVFF